MDGHPAYASAIADLKQTGELGLGPKGNAIAQCQSIHTIFGIAV